MWRSLIYDIYVQVAIFLIQRNRHALIGRAIDDHDMERVLQFLKNDPVCFLSLFCHMMKVQAY